MDRQHIAGGGERTAYIWEDGQHIVGDEQNTISKGGSGAQEGGADIKNWR